MEVNYEDIDYRLKILYDAVYNSSTKNCYSTNKIVLNNISLIDIKAPHYYDMSSVFKKSNMKFINNHNNRLYFKRISGEYPCTLIISKYGNINNKNNMNSSRTLNNALMHYILSSITIDDKYKHIMLPILCFDATYKQLTASDTVIEELDKIEKYNDDDIFNVFVRESYFKTESLAEYIKSEFTNMTLMTWKVLFFQVFFMLAKITETYDYFRHNKYDLESIKIYRKKEDNESMTYEVNDFIFSVPNVGFEIKITDFYESVIHGFVNNSIKKNKENPYYDIHYFCSSLLLFLEKENKKISDDVKNFIDDMIHPNFMPDPKIEFTGLDEFTFDKTSSSMPIPINILTKNNFFNSFIMDRNTSPIDNNTIKLNRLSQKDESVRYSSITDDGGSRSLARMITNKQTKTSKKTSKNTSKKTSKKTSKNTSKNTSKLNSKNTHKKNTSKKKSKQYNNNTMNSKIIGKRKMVTSGFNDSKSKLLDVAEKKASSKKNMSSTSGGSCNNSSDILMSTVSSSTKQSTTKSKKNHKKDDVTETSEQQTEPTTQYGSSVSQDDSSSSTSSSDSSSSSDYVQNSSENKSSKTSSKTSSQSPSSTSSSSTSSSSSSSFSGGSSVKSPKGGYSINSIKLVDPSFAEKINRGPQGFVGEVPPGLMERIQNMNQGGNPMGGMPPMGDMFPMGMQQPPMGMQQPPMGMQSPMGMQQHMGMQQPPMGMQQHMGMQQPPMGMQQQMGGLPQMGSALGLPRMTGGSRKYKFSSSLTSPKTPNNFFF